MLARCGMCFQGMGAVETGGFEVLAQGGICFEGMGGVEKGV